MRRTTSAGLALAIGLVGRHAAATSPPTIYDNYQMFPVGSRAAGMGGAYTALACDEAALHYNPAALGCADSSRLEVTANAYMLQAYAVPNAFGRGQDISAVTYHSIPTIVGAVRIVRDADEPSGVGRVTFGLGVSLPQSLALKIDPPNPNQINYVSNSVRDDVTAGDIGVGWQVTPWLAVGASIGGALRTFEAHAGFLLVDTTALPCGPKNAASCRDFVALSTEQSAFAIGGRGKFGARVVPAEHLSLGLVVTTPTFDVYGQYTENDTLTGTLTAVDAKGNQGQVFAAEPTRLTGSSEVGFPLRVAIGGAYSAPRWTLSVDASLNFPHQVRVAYDLTAVHIQGVAPQAGAIPALTYAPQFQPNANVGLATTIAKNIELDLGAFTDISSVSSDAKHSLDRVNMFGGSFAIGVLGKQSRGWVGASYEAASAGRVPSGHFTLEEVLQTGLPNDDVDCDALDPRRDHRVELLVLGDTARVANSGRPVSVEGRRIFCHEAAARRLSWAFIGCSNTRGTGGGAGGASAGGGGAAALPTEARRTRAARLRREARRRQLGSGGGRGTSGTSGTGGGSSTWNAGNPDGSCTAGVPAEGQPVDTSNSTNVVGDGTAGSCTFTALKNAVTAGGVITFKCGGAITIPITSTLNVPYDKDTVIDGGQKVTLDGQHQVQILSFNSPNWQNNEHRLTLQHIALVNAKMVGSDTEDLVGAAAPARRLGTTGGKGRGVHARRQPHRHRLDRHRQRGGPARPRHRRRRDLRGRQQAPAPSSSAAPSRTTRRATRPPFAASSASTTRCIQQPVLPNTAPPGSGANNDPSKCSVMDNGQNEVGSGGNGGDSSVGRQSVNLLLCGDKIVDNAAGMGASGAGFFTSNNMQGDLSIIDTTMTGNTGGAWTNVATGSMNNRA